MLQFQVTYRGQRLGIEIGLEKVEYALSRWRFGPLPDDEDSHVDEF